MRKLGQAYRVLWITSVALIAVIVAGWAMTVHAENATYSERSNQLGGGEHAPISIYIDGERLDDSVQAHLFQSRTFVPIRVIAEKWGASVGWNPSEKMVRIQKQSQRIDLFIGQMEVIHNGKLIHTEAPPMIVEGSTMLPLRFVGELLGADIDYRSDTRSVIVQLPLEPEPDPEPVRLPSRISGSANQGIAGTVRLSNSGATNPTTPIPGTINSPNEPVQEEQQPVPIKRVDLEQIEVQDGQVIFRTAEEVPSTIFYLRNPDRIVIDLRGVRIAIPDGVAAYDSQVHQYIMEVDDGSIIRAVRYAYQDTAQSQVRVVVDLESRGRYTVQKEQDKTTIRVLSGNYLIVVDPGHGGKDPGATSISGRPEKEFNLSMALLVEQMLQAETNIDVVLTRSTDIFLELQDRVDLANPLHPDAFLSIHANAFSQSTRGTETFFSHDNQYRFASIIHRHLVQATGFPDRKVQRKNFFVTRNSIAPAALVEVGFLSNPVEDAMMQTTEFRHRVARALVAGIKEYLGVM